MKRYLTLSLAVVLGVALLAPQGPLIQNLGFTDIGGNDATASFIYGRDASDNPVLDLAFTTSDTQAIRFAAAGPNFTVGDGTYTFLSDSEDAYYVLTQPDGDLTGGAFTFPAIGASDSVTTTTDNALLCQQVFMPGILTVNNIMVRGVVGSDSATDDTLAVAIYEDADAGTRLITTGASSDFTTTANATLAVTDTTLQPGFYRLCGCSQDISGVAFHAAALDDESIDVMNQGTVTFGTGANACASGVPPTTTGALTTADDAIPVIKLSGS